MQKEQLVQLNLPDEPGVYHFIDGQKNILYVGRATSLRNRVRSYFNPDVIHTRGAHIVDMVTKSSTVKYTQTDSVLESVLLESQHIKQLQPPYNTKEKDGKTYLYIVITKETLPRVFAERKRVLDFPEKLSYKIKATYGPFPHGPTLRAALKILRKIFPFRNKKSTQLHTERFYQQLGLAPTVGNIEAEKAYKKTIQNLEKVLQGKKKGVIKNLEKKMKQLAKEELFEQAAKKRNQIFALNHINDVSLIKLNNQSYGLPLKRIEAYDIAHTSGTYMVGVMTVIIGNEPDKTQYRSFNIKGFNASNDVGALHEVLTRRFNHPEWDFPDLLVIDGGEAQYRMAQNFVIQNNLHIEVAAVVKDESHNPKDILWKKTVAKRYDDAIILLANSESHRFAQGIHSKKRGKQFKKPRK